MRPQPSSRLLSLRRPKLPPFLSCHPHRSFTGRSSQRPKPSPPVSKLARYALPSILAGAAYLYFWYGNESISDEDWPPEVRKELRSMWGGYMLNSEPHLQRAWTVAKSLPVSSFSSNPLLRPAMLALHLGSVLRDNGKLNEAFEVYDEALSWMEEASDALSPVEKHAMGVFALKLRSGTMQQVKGKEETVEKHTLAAIHSLEANKSVSSWGGVSPDGPREDGDGEMHEQNQGSWWDTKMNIAIQLQLLGDLYEQIGKLDRAATTYLQLISLMMHSGRSTKEDQCHAACIMLKLSEIHIANRQLGDQHLAYLWGIKALEIADLHASAERPNEPSNCKLVLLLASLNAVRLHLLEGAPEEARKWFFSSMKLAHILGPHVKSDMLDWLIGLKALFEEGEAPDPPIDSRWTSLEP